MSVHDPYITIQRPHTLAGTLQRPLFFGKNIDTYFSAETLPYVFLPRALRDFFVCTGMEGTIQLLLANINPFPSYLTSLKAHYFLYLNTSFHPIACLWGTAFTSTPTITHA